jgi:hypothetical protein
LANCSSIGVASTGACEPDFDAYVFCRYVDVTKGGDLVLGVNYRWVLTGLNGPNVKVVNVFTRKKSRICGSINKSELKKVRGKRD